MSEVAEVVTSTIADRGYTNAQALRLVGLPESDRSALAAGTLPAWKLRALCDLLALPEGEVYNAKHADLIAGASERVRRWWDKAPIGGGS
jgi:hypothetical protein